MNSNHKPCAGLPKDAEAAAAGDEYVNFTMPSTPREWARCPVDRKVKQPRQVKVGVERAEALIAGKQPRPVEASVPRKPRKARATSERAVRRLEALFQAYFELPPEFQKKPTGKDTVEQLRKAVMQKMGYKALSEETIKKDIQAIRPLLRLVQEGRMPPFGLRQVTAVMRARFERTKFRFKKFEKNLNPKCNCCVAYNWHHTPRYWGAIKATTGCGFGRTGADEGNNESNIIT
jgi:hypothetical protein